MKWIKKYLYLLHDILWISPLLTQIILIAAIGSIMIEQVSIILGIVFLIILVPAWFCWTFACTRYLVNKNKFKSSILKW